VTRPEFVKELPNFRNCNFGKLHLNARVSQSAYGRSWFELISYLLRNKMFLFVNRNN